MEPTTTNEHIIEVQGTLKLLDQKIHTIETNHLAHIQKDIDRILVGLSAVGMLVLGQLLYILTK
jgi:Mg2+ and Co2+ transporter CorA